MNPWVARTLTSLGAAVVSTAYIVTTAKNTAAKKKAERRKARGESHTGFAPAGREAAEAIAVDPIGGGMTNAEFLENTKQLGGKVLGGLNTVSGWAKDAALGQLLAENPEPASEADEPAQLEAGEDATDTDGPLAGARSFLNRALGRAADAAETADGEDAPNAGTEGNGADGEAGERAVQNEDEAGSERGPTLSLPGGLPDVSLPKVELPKVDLSDVSLPKVDMPESEDVARAAEAASGALDKASTWLQGPGVSKYDQGGSGRKRVVTDASDTGDVIMASFVTEPVVPAADEPAADDTGPYEAGASADGAEPAVDDTDEPGAS